MTPHTVARYIRAHVSTAFANPYLACDQCQARVTEWHVPHRCGCDESGWQNQPCGHQASITSACPSWGPVDGCRCMDHLGHVPHGPTAATERAKP